MDSSLILAHQDVMNKIRRVAHEIHERFHHVNELVFISILGGGSAVAESLKTELIRISNIQVTSIIAEITKKKPDLNKIRLQGNSNMINGRVCIVVDDVINSGKTLMYVCSSIVSQNPSQLMAAVIIDRFHRTYPIKADFVGLTLSTNLKENVSLKNENGSFSVWLEG
jgi:pyrimidine operon attenuation protein/uracil phosphoribosyltransferase